MVLKSAKNRPGAYQEHFSFLLLYRLAIFGCDQPTMERHRQGNNRKTDEKDGRNRARAALRERQKVFAATQRQGRKNIRYRTAKHFFQVSENLGKRRRDPKKCTLPYGKAFFRDNRAGEWSGPLYDLEIVRA